MPYKIRKLPNKNLYRVYNSDTGAIHAYGTSKKNAERQVRLMYMMDAAKRRRASSKRRRK